MSAETECRKCGSDLEAWNNGKFLWINYCPSCGAKLLKKQVDVLHDMTTISEVSGMIRDKLLGMLVDKQGGDVSADELAQAAWESENCNGAVFCSNCEAGKFAMRHEEWANDAMEYVCDNFGDAERYVKMKMECVDRFLVLAFIYATESYLYDQLGIDRDEGDLPKRRIKEIMRQVKRTEYDGRF